MCIPSKRPPAPIQLAPAPKPVTRESANKEIKQAQDEERDLQRKKRGRRSTLLDSPLTDKQQLTVRTNTLLGE